MGENKTFILSPKEAYGEIDPSLFRGIFLNETRQNLSVGDEIQRYVNNTLMVGRVIIISGDHAIVNFNHPLAGEYVKVYLEVVDIRR